MTSMNESIKGFVGSLGILFGHGNLRQDLLASKRLPLLFEPRW